MSDPIAAEDRPHRVSALTGVDPDPETTGIDPANRAQGTGRFDDDEAAERRQAAADATAERADAARSDTQADTANTTANTASAYSADDVPETAADVVAWLQAATTAEDRVARAQVAGAVEADRDGGPRKTVTDELNR